MLDLVVFLIQDNASKKEKKKFSFRHIWRVSPELKKEDASYLLENNPQKETN